MLTVLCITGACAVPAAAQHDLHNVPPVISAEGDNPDLLHPFIDPLAFDPDFQFFAPADFDSYGDGPEANTGWFATYDRVYIYMSRPENQPTYTEGDFTWGNRYDLGYMSDEEHGWLFSAWHINGPQAVDVLRQERINVYEEDDEVYGNVNAIVLRGGGGGGGGTPVVGQPTPGVPLQDTNDPITGARDYRLEDYLNVANVSSFELNKTFRCNQKHYGSWIEPFCGVRYVNLSSWGNFDQYYRYDEETAIRVPLGFPVPIDLADTATIEQFIRNQTSWVNHMVGGQLGFRWFKQKDRWLLSTDVRAFACQNFQSFHYMSAATTTYYDGADVGADVLYEWNEYRQGLDGHDSEFVIGTEIRAEAAYAISKAFSVRAGATFMDFGRGVARSNNLWDNSEDVILVGCTFGATLNR
jgi:hypothetical protein